MIEISANFVSAVCTGSFNPAILTSRFLRDVCRLSVPEDVSEQNTPVVSQLSFGATSIHVDFNSFQAISRDCKKTAIIGLLAFATTYLGVLKYTPLRAYGLNFNYTVTGVTSEYLGLEFYNHLRDVGLEFDDTIEVVATLRHNKTGNTDLRGAELSFGTLEGLQCKMSINNLREQLIVNMNFEIAGLEDDSKQTANMQEQFDDIYAVQEKVIRSVFPG